MSIIKSELHFLEHISWFIIVHTQASYATRIIVCCNTMFQFCTYTTIDHFGLFSHHKTTKTFIKTTCQWWYPYTTIIPSCTLLAWITCLVYEADAKICTHINVFKWVYCETLFVITRIWIASSTKYSSKQNYVSPIKYPYLLSVDNLSEISL